MPADTARATNNYWPLAWTLVALVSTYVFLQDLINPQWPAWVLTPLLFVGFRAAVTIVPADSLARALLYQAALILVPFMGVYALVDAAVSADWTPWVVAPVVVVLLWTFVTTISEAEAD